MLNSFLFYYGLPVYNKVSDYIHTIYTNIYETYENVLFGLNSDVLVFFKNDDHPYFENYFNNTTDITTWKYNKYKNVFFNYNCLTKDTKRFPLLSASIGIKKETTFIKLFDLDDFIDTVHIEASNFGYPNLTQFIYAYMYTNKIYINKSNDLYINYLDINANESMKKLFIEDFDFCINKE